MVGRRPVALLRVRSRRHLEHLPHGVRRRDDAVDESPDGRQRHHRAEPGPVGCRRTAGVQRVRGQRLHDLRARVSRTARRGPRREPADQRGGAAAAEGWRRTGLRGGHQRDARTPVRGCRGGAGRGIQAQARPGLRRAADSRGRPRSVRHLRRRRHLAGVQRHARQPRRSTPARRRPTASTSSAATSPTSTARTAGTGARQSIRHPTSTGRSMRV